MSQNNIETLIPQRWPFVMVDKLLFANDTMARTRFKITADNIFVSGKAFREPGMVENMAQSAAARAGFLSAHEKKEPSIGYIGDVKNLEILHLPEINDEIETEIRIENQIFGVTIIKATIFCEEKLMASCEMKIFITQPK